MNCSTNEWAHPENWDGMCCGFLFQRQETALSTLPVWYFPNKMRIWKSSKHDKRIPDVSHVFLLPIEDVGWIGSLPFLFSCWPRANYTRMYIQIWFIRSFQHVGWPLASRWLQRYLRKRETGPRCISWDSSILFPAKPETKVHNFELAQLRRKMEALFSFT